MLPNAAVIATPSLWAALIATEFASTVTEFASRSSNGPALISTSVAETISNTPASPFFLPIC